MDDCKEYSKWSEKSIQLTKLKSKVEDYHSEGTSIKYAELIRGKNIAG